jgi:hypothetical protein
MTRRQVLSSLLGQARHAAAAELLLPRPRPTPKRRPAGHPRTLLGDVLRRCLPARRPPATGVAAPAWHAIIMPPKKRSSLVQQRRTLARSVVRPTIRSLCTPSPFPFPCTGTSSSLDALCIHRQAMADGEEIRRRLPWCFGVWTVAKHVATSCPLLLSTAPSTDLILPIDLCLLLLPQHSAVLY